MSNMSDEYTDITDYDETSDSDIDSKPVKRKHVFLFIGDGMHLEHEIACSLYLYGEERSLSFHNFPYSGVASTWDILTYDHAAGFYGQPLFNYEHFDPRFGYDISRGGALPFPDGEVVDEKYFVGADAGEFISYATDSAASATAMATGFKTKYGRIAWSSDDTVNGTLETIAELARRKNSASIGVVTTVKVSGATPAAFISHNLSRGNYSEIFNEMLFDVEPDVLIGAGHPHFYGTEDTPSYYFVTQAGYDYLKSGSSDYVFAERKKDVRGSEMLFKAADQAVTENRKLFGLFGTSIFEYPIPQNNPGRPQIAVYKENPSLSDGVRAAFRVLSENRNGFFLMAEQGTIDLANHANNYYNMIGTVADLDHAVKTAVELINRKGDEITWENTMIIVTADHSNSYMRLKRDDKGVPVLGLGELPEMEGKDYDHDYPGEEVSYRSTNHTNELVKVYATGGTGEFSAENLFKKYEGLWYPGTIIIDDTMIYDVTAEFIGLK